MRENHARSERPGVDTSARRANMPAPMPTHHLAATLLDEAHAREAIMRWVTRSRPKTDRIACPWLLRRFIDKDAEILFLPPADVVPTAAKDAEARSFDAPGADYTHRGDRCTFEVLIEEFELGGDPALQRLAQIVHAADISDDLETDPLGPGLLAIGEGGLDVEADDQRLLERGSFVYDALYAWCKRQVAVETGVR